MASTMTADKNFACFLCEKSDQLTYNEQRYEIRCTRCQIDYSIERITNMELARGKIWITKDRRAIPIAEMDDTHLLNAIGKMIREPDWRPGMMEPLVDELERRRKLESAA